MSCPTGEKILLDCGIYQSNKPLEDYRINNKKFKFKPEEVTAVIISHINADHYCLLPKLVRDGFYRDIYIAEETVSFARPMLEDSAKIMEKDSMFLSRRNKKTYDPIYDEEDVKSTLPLFKGVTKNTIHQITDNVSFRFLSAGHIFGSCQIELFIKLPSGSIKKVGYSGDLGNIIFEQPFVEDFKPMVKCDIFIGETTYNDPKRSSKKKQREKDIEKLKNVVTQTCVEKKGIVLIPTFALQRTETMLYMLYKIFGNDTSFKVPVIIDSPLAVALLDCFNQNLVGEDKKIFNEIMNWKNLNIIRDFEESFACINDKQPKVVLSSSGMLTCGRCLSYLEKILPRSNCAIITCGYMAEGTIGWKIKNRSSQKTITIDKKTYRNRCDIKSLNTFSSHMQHDELLKYYTNIANNGCSIIWLVHGDKGKIEFKKELEENIRRINRTTKVVATNKETVARIG